MRILKKSTHAIILARGGSKGIKHKNLLKIKNKPLVYWSIINSIKSKKIDHTWVSSDSNKILNISKKFINTKESNLIDSNSIKELTLAWCIKEAIYKLFRSPGLDFKDEIKIQSISNNLSHSFTSVEKLDKKYFFKSFNIIDSDYICSIVQSNE